MKRHNEMENKAIIIGPLVKKVPIIKRLLCFSFITRYIINQKRDRSVRIAYFTDEFY